MFTVVGNKHNAKKMAKVQKDVFRALLLDLFNYKITQWEVRFKSHQDHRNNFKTFFAVYRYFLNVLNVKLMFLQL